MTRIVRIECEDPSGDTENMKELALYVETELSRMVAGRTFRMLASASTASDIINLLPSLAVAQGRVIRGRRGGKRGPRDGQHHRPSAHGGDGKVAVMRGCFSSSRPGPMSVYTRSSLRKANRPFVTAATKAQTLPWLCPLSYAYERELLAADAAANHDHDHDHDHDDGLTLAEERSLERLRALIRERNCTVVLVEVFTADRIKGHRRCFLQALRGLTRDSGVLLVHDETFSSVRCGRTFGFEWYDRSCVPDLIVVGKAWKAAALLAVDAPLGMDVWSDIISGNLTSQIDERVARSMLHFLRVVSNGEVAANCERMGRWIRQNIPVKGSAFLRGIGAMWFTTRCLHTNDDDV
jgi:hypothetical protein